MVARLTPDQKVACSILVGLKPPNLGPLIFLPFSVQKLQNLNYYPSVLQPCQIDIFLCILREFVLISLFFVKQFNYVFYRSSDGTICCSPEIFIFLPGETLLMYERTLNAKTKTSSEELEYSTRRMQNCKSCNHVTKYESYE